MPDDRTAEAPLLLASVDAKATASRVVDYVELSRAGAPGKQELPAARFGGRAKCNCKCN